MLERAREIGREAAIGAAPDYTMILPEPKLDRDDVAAQDRLSKIFKIHRHEPIFNEFCRRTALLDLIEDLLGAELDCFLSQFIFKQPGALGQPWHQDSFYFPFDTDPQVGIWLAVTESTADNGPLHVLRGSHNEPVHPVVADRRPGASFGYVEIVDHDMSGEMTVVMQPGDLLVFHSHLMHRSTDNLSERLRAAMVYHYAQAGTSDNTEQVLGFRSPNNDWMPVRRVAAPS
jgi:ectoine hydroxylase-related dioxygenase (phytanoyl-CoA dioxygenase family)